MFGFWCLQELEEAIALSSGSCGPRGPAGATWPGLWRARRAPGTPLVISVGDMHMILRSVFEVMQLQSIANMPSQAVGRLPWPRRLIYIEIPNNLLNYRSCVARKLATNVNLLRSLILYHKSDIGSISSYIFLAHDFWLFLCRMKLDIINFRSYFAYKINSMIS